MLAGEQPQTVQFMGMELFFFTHIIILYIFLRTNNISISEIVA